jgi:hypothetical protein
MLYTERWCSVCGAYKDECRHKEARTTNDAVEALRIRLIYQGIEIDKDKRTHK